jgi:mannose-6-phosphate isomerase
MTNIYKLFNQFKHYDWGSPYLIPEYLGFESQKNCPYAEMWMGTHHNAPSKIELNGESVNLSEISGELSFLFKLLAVEKPLSIQVHPNKKQAEEGFNREEKKAVSLLDPTRTYMDKNQKSEIICAITPSTLMAGFKSPEDIYNSLGELSDDQLLLIKKFEELYPNDHAKFSPLYLNIIKLQPGQAIYLPPNIPHSYFSGFGLELMDNSDNVIRGGLTSKYIDTFELKKIINNKPFLPEIITPSSDSIFNYPMPQEEYSLLLVRGDGRKILFPVKENTICFVIEGELKTGKMTYKKGQSFFIPKNTDKAEFEGKFTLYIASGGKLCF